MGKLGISGLTIYVIAYIYIYIYIYISKLYLVRVVIPKILTLL